MARRLHRRSVVKGQITVPAVPGMIDAYVSMCETLFTAVEVTVVIAEKTTVGVG